VTFLMLVMGHALADFSFQNEWMAKYKNRHAGRSYTPGYTTWPYVLSAHALIHGLMVALITGNPMLGAAETLCHWLIDFGKCESWYGIHADQSMHIFCKVAWAVMA
jgi:hypothetical protein